MAFLTPDKVITVTTPSGDKIEIKQKIIPDNMKAQKDIASWCKKGQLMKPNKPLGGDGKPRGITVHNTADIKEAKGTNDAEQYARATYNGNMSGVVVHYYVYKDEVWQLLKETERGWHATDGSTRRKSQDGKSQIGGNLDTIAIECVGSSAESEDTTAKLVAYLCDKYKLDKGDIYQHKWFYPSKNCPQYIRPHWNEFLELCEDYLTKKEKKEEKKENNNVTTEKAPEKVEKKFTPYIVKIDCNALNVRNGPGTKYKINTVVRRGEAYTIVDKNGSWGKLKSGAGWISLNYTKKK